MNNSHSSSALNPRLQPGRQIPLSVLLLAIALIVPALAALSILYLQAVSAPFQDDYHGILGFGTAYVHSSGLLAKTVLIATFQHNEYKLIIDNLVVGSEISLTGRVNFAFLNVVGNIFLLPIAYLLWLIYRKRQVSLQAQLIHFLPIMILFFSLAYWETVDWASDSLPNLPATFFAFLAIYFLASEHSVRRPAISILLACLCMIAAAFSYANGLLVGPIGLLILLPRRAYRAALAWCGCFVLSLLPYLIHYVRPPHPRAKLVFLTRPLEFLACMGSAIPWQWPAVLLGMTLVAIAGAAVFGRFDRKNPVAFYSTAWVVGTGLMVAWVRGANGITVPSRYSIYSLLTAIFCYAFLAERLDDRAHFKATWFRVAATLCAVIFCLWADAQAYQKLGQRRQQVLAGLEHYRANPALNSPQIDPYTIRNLPGEDREEQKDLTAAIESGIYALPLEEPEAEGK